MSAVGWPSGMPFAVLRLSARGRRHPSPRPWVNPPFFGRASIDPRESPVPGAFLKRGSGAEKRGLPARHRLAHFSVAGLALVIHELGDGVQGSPKRSPGAFHLASSP